MKKILVIIATIISLVACQNNTTEYESLNKNFKTNRQNYEKIANFVEQESEGFDFASIDVLNENELKFVLEKNGVEKLKALNPNNFPLENINFIQKNKIFIMKENDIIYFQTYGTKKEGVQKTGGILKKLTNKKVEINFSWVQDFQTENINENWYKYKIN